MLSDGGVPWMYSQSYGLPQLCCCGYSRWMSISCAKGSHGSGVGQGLLEGMHLRQGMTTQMTRRG